MVPQGSRRDTSFSNACRLMRFRVRFPVEAISVSARHHFQLAAIRLMNEFTFAVSIASQRGSRSPPLRSLTLPKLTERTNSNRTPRQFERELQPAMLLYVELRFASSGVSVTSESSEAQTPRTSTHFQKQANFQATLQSDFAIVGVHAN